MSLTTARLTAVLILSRYTKVPHTSSAAETPYGKGRLMPVHVSPEWRRGGPWRCELSWPGPHYHARLCKGRLPYHTSLAGVSIDVQSLNDKSSRVRKLGERRKQIKGRQTKDAIRAGNQGRQYTPGSDGALQACIFSLTTIYFTTRTVIPVYERYKYRQHVSPIPRLRPPPRQ